MAALAGEVADANAQSVFVDGAALLDYDPTLRSQTSTTMGLSAGVGLFMSPRLSTRVEFDLPQWHLSRYSGSATLPNRVETYSFHEEDRGPSISILAGGHLRVGPRVSLGLLGGTTLVTRSWGGGLARDVHMRTRYAAPFCWSLGDDPSPFAVDFMATMVHELGHALGLGHRVGEPSMMSGTQLWRYAGLGSAFLFPRDIVDIQAIYGIGMGSVQPRDDVMPTPEPGTLLLLSVPLAALLRRRQVTARDR